MSSQKGDLSSLPEKNRVEGGTLYLVATPIGNLADLSERAVKVLSEDRVLICLRGGIEIERHVEKG